MVIISGRNKNTTVDFENIVKKKRYDSHRESILRGIDDAEGEELHNINLWGFFSSSCFSGYDINEENNFYSVYGNLFAELDRHEEMEEFTDEYHGNFILQFQMEMRKFLIGN